MSGKTGTVTRQPTKGAAHVLLIGGAGYIGRHVAWQLHDAGIPVVILDDLSTGSRDYLPPCDFIEADIIRLDNSALAPWAGKVGAVMHFAALTSVPESLERPETYYRLNVGGTVRALELASFLGAGGFVFSSTAAVYGEPEYLPVTEAHPTRPQNPYGTSKLAAEMAVSDYCRAHGMTGVLLRYFNVAGSDPDRRTGDMREPGGNLIHQLLRCLDREGEEFCIYGTDYDTPDGTPRRDFVHVCDVAAAHTYVVQHPERLDRTVNTFNIGYGHPFSVREILDTFRSMVPERHAPRVREKPRRPGDIAEIWADSSALRALGWIPALDDIRAIIRDNVNWHLRNPDECQSGTDTNRRGKQ